MLLYLHLTYLFVRSLWNLHKATLLKRIHYARFSLPAGLVHYAFRSRFQQNGYGVGTIVNIIVILSLSMSVTLSPSSPHQCLPLFSIVAFACLCHFAFASGRFFPAAASALGDFVPRLLSLSLIAFA